MALKIIKYNIEEVSTYIDYMLHRNSSLTSDNIDFVTEIFNSNHEEIFENPRNLYLFLSLINKNCFTGCFSTQFNSKLVENIQTENYDEILNSFLNPNIDQFCKNKYLNEEEEKELADIMNLEIMATNLTLKRIILQKIITSDFDKTYEESYYEIFHKLFRGILNDSRELFQNFVLITEKDSQTGIKYTYTYALNEIMDQLVNRTFVRPVSQNNIDWLKERYALEYKVLKLLNRHN
jgi:hypothetical protein